jgi:hypothetical protein
MHHRPLRQQDVAFFGATTASVSHELKNVVTIINETAGLLHDLTLAADRGRPLDTLRVRKIATDVSSHVARAVEILNRLNRFAHSTDAPKHSFDLCGVVRDAAALSARPASLRSMELEARVPPGPIWVSSYAFGLHQLITLGIRLLVQGNPSPTTITLVLEQPRDAGPDAADGDVGRGPTASATDLPAGRRAVVRIAPMPVVPSEVAPSAWDELCVLAAELGSAASFVPEQGERAGAVLLAVPAT